jgi:hypothetical protein
MSALQSVWVVVVIHLDPRSAGVLRAVLPDGIVR